MPTGVWGRFVESIANRAAFFPPRPPTYEVQEHGDRTGDLYIRPTDPSVPRVTKAIVKMIPTKATRKGEGGASSIVTAYVPYLGRKGEKTTTSLLYSHGNAVDLGHMMPVFRELSNIFKVNVMAYDYTGYGCSARIPAESGIDGSLSSRPSSCTSAPSPDPEINPPSVGHTLSDVTAVYEHLVTEHRIPPQRIILYGQSVGSGPTCYLASELGSEVGGVVFHSPLLSGVRVLKPDVSWWPSWADVFPNHILAPKITAPVLVMHGTEDEVIDISCAKKLHELCKNKVEPLWAQGFNHQNLEGSPDYIPVLAKFIDKVSAAAEALESGGGHGGGGGSTKEGKPANKDAVTPQDGTGAGSGAS